MKNADEGETGKTIKSVETAFRIADLIKEREAAGVTELAGELDCSKSTVHHYVKTLEQLDYLEKQNGKYRLGIRFLAFGGAARANRQLFQLAKSHVDDLADEIGEQVRLVAEQNDYGIILYQSTGDNLSSPYNAVGSVEPLHCTAAGKAFLAELPRERARELLDRVDLPEYTEETITDAEELERELREIRSEQVAFDDEERFEGVRCVAVPISGSTGETLGALSVSGPKERMTEERYRETIPRKLRNVAGVVEINTTYSGWADDSGR